MALHIATPSAYGQASSSSDIAGKVTDATGATVAGATVHVINNGTKAERTVRTNDSGEWSVPNIPPASYSVRVEKPGFKASLIPAIDVEIGKTANGTVTLAVGGAEETIEVSTLPPQLQTQEATVGQVIDQKQINDLPINGRNVLQLATLAPGVSPAQTGQTGAPAQTGTRQLYITVDGGRGNSTNYVLDGTYVRSIRFNNMSLQPGVDTLQEFNLLRSTFSTEYGQGQAVVSMVTKSGSNTFHGSGYEFARNAIFDARNYFQPAVTAAGPQAKPDFYRHQFGGTLGFPVIKDKLFLFGGYEGQRSARTSQSFALYPTANELNGNWDLNSTQVINPVGGYSYSKQNPVGFTLTNRAATVLNPTYPSVTSDAAILNGGTANYQGATTFQDTYDQFTIRGDYNLSQKSTLFGRYVNFDSNQISPNLIGSGTANPLLGRNAVLGHTYLVTPRIVNEVRIGWNEFYNITLGTITNQGPGGNWAVAEGLQNVTSINSPRQNGRAGFTIANFGSVGDGAGDQGGHENIISIGDSVSVSFAKHTVKFGFQGQNRRLWQIADNNSRGGASFDNCTLASYGNIPGTTTKYTPTGPDDPNNVTSVGNCPIGQKSYVFGGQTFLYNKFQNYARGLCTGSCNGNAGTTLGHYRDNTYGAFINDIWQIGHGLTVNAGMRWEYNSPFVEQNGLEGTLDPTTKLVTFSKLPKAIPATYLPYIDTSRTYSPGIVQPQRKGFMPRLGVAYQATPGTVIRAGYGIYIENANTNELQFTRYAAPLYFQQAFTNVSTNNLFPDPLATTGQLPSPFSIFPNNTRPLTQEWNLSLQQDLGHGVLLEMAYTGSNTHHLWKRYDQNMYKQFPFVIPTSYVRPYTQFGQGILTSSTLGAANFNGGSIKLEQRTKKGLYYLGSYQWSKNLDNISGEAGANDSSYATTTSFDHSYSNFDTRNRAVISGGYELPFGKGKAFLQDRVSTAVLGGWSFQPAIQLRTGYPFNIGGSGCTFAANIGCRAFLAPGRTVASSYKQNRGISNWFDPTAFSNDPLVATITGTPGAYVASSARNLPNLQGWVTRNVGRGPGTVSFDLSAIKNFKVYERLNLQFRAEAYNVINHGIFSNPSAGIGTASSVGKITGTSMDNRSIQLAIKGTF